MWQSIKDGYQWIKTNLIICGGLIVTILLALLTFYKRKADSLEVGQQTQEKRGEVKQIDQQAKEAEKTYDDQKKSYENTLDEYNRKYRSGNGDGGSSK